MMRNYIVVLLIALISFTSFGQDTNLEELNSDLNYLQEVLYSSHPGTFMYITRDSLDDLFNKLQFESDDENINYFELQKRVRIILSQIGCIHTSVEKSNFNYKKERIPLEVFAKNDQIWVVNSLNESFNYTGYEVLNINGHSSKNMIHSFKDYHASDGYNQTFKYALINEKKWFNNLYQFYFDTDSIKSYTLVSPQLDTISLDLKNVEPAEEEKTKKVGQQFGDNVSVVLDSLHHLAIMKVKSYSGMVIWGKIINKRHYEDALIYISDHGFDNLVVDLRGNGGGDAGSATKFLSLFVEGKHYFSAERHKGEIFKYAMIKSKFGFSMNFLLGNLFASRTPTLTPRVSKSKFKKDKWFTYEGNVFVITDGFTASAASNVASGLKHLTDATLVGVESGGGANNLNAFYYAVVKLPHSKIKFRVPQYKIDLRLMENRGHGVMPDLKVDYTYQDIIEKKDLEIESIIQEISEN